MKKLVYKYIYYLQFLCLAAPFLFMSACQKDTIEAPVITGVLNYAAAPNDTAVQTIQVGQWVVLVGKNLSGISQVYFGGVPATINTTLFTDESIVVQLPSIPFPLISREELNKVTAIGEGGTATFNINITGAPIISYVRNYAESPNDTVSGIIVPGQHINIIGYNLRNALAIAFQGIEADLTEIIYTDSSAIVKVPTDFSGGIAALANKMSYTTTVGASTLSIPIFDPAILEYYKDPLWISLTGGIGNEKTWVLDFDANAVSVKFAGPMFFCGLDYGWDNLCTKEGGDCWTWQPPYQTWMPVPKDYGTMTFKLGGNPITPVVTVDQKEIELSGIFSDTFFLDTEAKTITFTDLVPLNMGWAQVWTTAYIISLTDDGMQLAFRHTEKPEMEIYNYIPKK